jgi:hypothetical protein
VGQRGQAGEHARASDPAASPPGAGAAAGAERRVDGREHERRQQVLGHERPRELDQYGIHGGEHQRHQPDELAEQLEGHEPDQGHGHGPEDRLGEARRMHRAASGRRVAVDQVNGRQKVGVAGREIGARPPCSAGPRARPVAGRVVAGVCDLARQRQVRAGVVDRPVGGSLNLRHANRERHDQHRDDD